MKMNSLSQIHQIEIFLLLIQRSDLLGASAVRKAFRIQQRGELIRKRMERNIRLSMPFIQWREARRHFTL